MTPLARSLSDDVVAFDLEAEKKIVRGELAEGAILLDALGATRALATGALVALDAGVRHAVSSPEGGMLLLTLTGPERPVAP